MVITERNLEIINGLKDKLKTDKSLNFKEYKTLLEKAYQLFSSNDPKLYNLGLSVICYVAEAQPVDKFIQQLLYDCMVASRVFLYTDMYERTDGNFLQNVETSFLDLISKEYYTLDTDTVLTKDQKSLFDDFQKYRRLVVSAPTSFGKSRIISEIIAHNVYKNIAIILPTIALLNETYQTFKKNKELSKYNLVNSLAQPIAEQNNILILTPEKMDLMLDQNPSLTIDFFTMDEVYKIQDDKERSNIFTHCLYRLTKMRSDFYLIGPYFEGFSQEFLNRTGAVFRKYSAEIVQKDTYDLSRIEYQTEYKIEDVTYKKLKDKDKNLINVLNAIKGQSLVYLGQRGRTEAKAKKIASKREQKYNNEPIDYIKENIHSEWSLATYLERGVAFHHSAMPKHIQSEIVDSFNKELVDVLICTSTLTEGVNTTAKNVIIYDNFKGKSDFYLNGFDVKNIKGRAGRFLSHFLGKVIVLEEIHQEEEKGIIEFSYYDDENLNIEETIQVDRDDLSGKNLQRRLAAEEELNMRRIPLSVIKMNKFIPVHQQINLINFLRKNSKVLRYLTFQSSIPNKWQLVEILELCHQYLFNQRDKEDKNFHISNLIRLTNFYIYKSPLIRDLINNQNGKHIDTKVRSTFYLISHYFEFTLPRYLTIFENLFNFVYKERYNKSDAISLKTLITKLEFGYINKHEVALREAGVPVNIINKIGEKFKDCEDLEEIRIKIKLDPFLLEELTSFEQNLLLKYL
ncbi:DEAD/DEAH box helicase [Bacillus anthracis]|uniref:DEAD/DEAH box helicase n=1 Tax=Bacillus anthracis TaxID=1392 RepID=UPI0001DBFC67|nr:DEAD/DEAH box helicase [Bacillus cereus]ADK04866.1 DEAD/DEAH box helicase domain protein [Bacillus cereus biovar anthracis str. CI]